MRENQAEIAFWGWPDVRRTEEAARWPRLEMHRRLEALSAAARKDEDAKEALEAEACGAITVVAAPQAAPRGRRRGRGGARL